MKTAKLTSTAIRGLSCLALLQCGVASGQRLMNATKDPHISYVYPAGAQRDTTATITVGGQYLEGADRIYVSGADVTATVVGYDRPLSTGEVVRKRNRLQQAGEEAGLTEDGRLRGKALRELLQKGDISGISATDIEKMGQSGQMRRKDKIQDHPQVAEKVSVQLTIGTDAALGRRELRVFRDGRLSEPLAFYIGDYPEHTEADGPEIQQALPVVINGQILPSEKDQFTFKARKGDQLVAACLARELIPHLADAVPGWFQAVMTLYDDDGNEVAYADDYEFNPDPTLCFYIPANGSYTLEINDSIFRGRQDFVYRITLGEVPFVTSIFPLGGTHGEKTNVKLEGQNLKTTQITVLNESRIGAINNTPLAYSVPFAQSTLPEQFEAEPNEDAEQAMPVLQGTIINGKIEKPGDRDVFSIPLGKDDELLAEVTARRLNSPLDSVLMITDAAGQQLAFNNDYEDRSLGRVTHHADARLIFRAPKTGSYFLHLGDIQNGGGSDYAYRLDLSTPGPDYELRVVPANLNAAPGSSARLTVYALRKDGFNGAIELTLNDNLAGLRLDGAILPAGQEKVELTVTFPSKPLDGPTALHINGHARIANQSLVRPAVPAEDQMQAFIYHHLVTVDELLLSNIQSAAPRNQSEWETKQVKLRAGKSTTLTCKTPTQIDPTQLGLKVEPHNFPSGITLEEVAVKKGTIALTIHTDRNIDKKMAGNLLFNLFIERTKPGSSQKREGKREPVFLPAGSLPAIPFEFYN